MLTESRQIILKMTTMPIREDDFAWFAAIRRGKPPERLPPGARLPEGGIAIGVHADPSPIWLNAGPVTGKLTVDEERSVGLKRSPANDHREGEIPALAQRHMAEANAFRLRHDLAPLPASEPGVPGQFTPNHFESPK
jgi:hypothetical protein